MLRPTLFLSFGVALFLALGPAPSDQCSKKGKCYVCGEPLEVSFQDLLSWSLLGRQATQEELSKAEKTPCGSGTGTEIDCSSFVSLQPGEQLGCSKIVGKRGQVQRGCAIIKPGTAVGCGPSTSVSGLTLCSCTGGLCNSSPSLRQKKHGPLSALGLALLIAYFGFILAHRI